MEVNVDDVKICNVDNSSSSFFLSGYFINNSYIILVENVKEILIAGLGA
jgi:hypothetical protein